ncbi:sugar ABC transporter ATP-binding protein [Methylovirgula sp. 4M-Z18]|uniref:sugar ABC transporter ATP-binding protein n=1 Tax=Methylovirgula sp. 4M-Z18 TaxID=2293567 RepID=UPI000E2F9808|nr:sugar ABC transporter ATP-binding protein [Methylovirgula sp. 4M-Z18]RFB78078.1 sugar ABC transporter ATP-binding protein [Methylovirgula sp. 4M-Z18]
MSGGSGEHADSTPAEAVLATLGVSKSFGGIEVLSDISIDLHAGEVHAVIGENGAGKSTLMKILAGHLPPSAGTLRIDGQDIHFAGPAEAERRGIVLVHQEIFLAPHLTVAQNIFLGREIRRGIGLDDAAMNRRAHAAVLELGADIRPTKVVEQLSIAQRQLVQIARALLVPHRVVIFDEPTASLTTIETEALLQVIEAIKAKGIAVLYISHRLQEVKAIADRVSVLRDGKWITTRDIGALEPLDMARLMVGRDIANLYPAKPPVPPAKALLQVEGFNVPGFARDATFTLNEGEILGFAGLIGAGRTELFEGLLGLRSGAGQIRVGETARHFHNAREAMDAGIVYLSEDRKGKGLLLAQDLRINLSLAALAKFQHGPLIDTVREWSALDEAFKTFDIRARSKKLLAGQLSGGNQQKLLVAKMMLLEPKIVIIDEPTRGIDVGTKAQIYRFIASLARSGKAVIVISSEMQELIGLCHRILVMRNGRITGAVEGGQMTEAQIVVYATGVDERSAAP